MCPPAAPGAATCFALVRIPLAAGGSASAGEAAYALNDGAASSGPAGGLTPAQLASAYGYQPAAGGTGQTVAIVDAYEDPNIERDLASFDGEYGLTACTTANGCFEKVNQRGSGAEGSLPARDVSGWSVEISLDVESVHAACPHCKILLVEADDPADSDLAAAVEEAVTLGASEVSNSYGGPEAGITTSEQAYDHPGVVIAAATGDDGYDDWDFIDEGYGAFEQPNAPASLPSVVAVGGTSLKLDPNGTRAGETVWNDEGAGDQLGFPRGFVSGGGCSTLFAAAPWQQSAPGFAATGCASKRLGADISAVADPYTGFDVYDSYDCGPDCEEYGIGKGKDWVTLGGTSLATPLITALYALAGGSGGTRYPALTLYGHLGQPSSLYDVTEGANGFCDAEPAAKCGTPNSTHGRVDCEGSTACNAAPGYDGPSGVGTPNGLGAFKPLFPAAVIAAPSAPTAGVGASFSAASSSDPYPGGSITAYSWSWGDGTPVSGGVAPTHTYAAPGTYSVTLTVTDNYGLSSSPATQSLDVGGASAKEVAVEEEAASRQQREALERAEEAASTQQREALERAEETASDQHREEVERNEEAATRQREEKLAREAGASSLNTGLQEVASFRSTVAAPVPDAELASTALFASPSGSVLARISCPSTERSCQGTITLRMLAGAVAGIAAAAQGRAAVSTLASAAFATPGGKVQALTLHLSPRTRALLARVQVLHVRAMIVAHDPAGITHSSARIATLRERKPKHGKG